jgi:hypothetical protein
MGNPGHRRYEPAKQWFCLPHFSTASPQRRLQPRITILILRFVMVNTRPGKHGTTAAPISERSCLPKLQIQVQAESRHKRMNKKFACSMVAAREAHENPHPRGIRAHVSLLFRHEHMIQIDAPAPAPSPSPPPHRRTRPRAGQGAPPPQRRRSAASRPRPPPAPGPARRGPPPPRRAPGSARPGGAAGQRPRARARLAPARAPYSLDARGVLSLTLMFLPPSSDSFSDWMADSASSWLLKVTKPKPLERPSGDLTTSADSTKPDCARVGGG